MKIKILLLIFLISQQSYSWGNKGHAIVAEIAFNYLNANTKKIVMS